MALILWMAAAWAVDVGGLEARALPPENIGPHLPTLRARVIKTSQETQRIAHQMRTAVLDELGLAISLRDLCRQFSEQHPDIAVDFADSVLSVSIPHNIATCLYRVAQEGLHNIASIPAPDASPSASI